MAMIAVIAWLKAETVMGARGRERLEAAVKRKLEGLPLTVRMHSKRLAISPP